MSCPHTDITLELVVEGPTRYYVAACGECGAVSARCGRASEAAAGLRGAQ